jgi:hypothetical protein
LGSYQGTGFSRAVKNQGEALPCAAGPRAASRSAQQLSAPLMLVVHVKVFPTLTGGRMYNEALVARFDEAMLQIYQRALAEASYKAVRFLQMLHNHRGLETARILLHAQTVSEGYTALWQRGRLDLTVEAVIHDNPKWHPLFTQDELNICKKRLIEYRYLPQVCAQNDMA